MTHAPPPLQSAKHKAPRTSLVFLAPCTLFLCLFFFVATPRAETIAVPSHRISVYFSPAKTPAGSAQEAIVSMIESATDGIRVMAYSFTAAPIADALVRAHERGVHVEVILDKSQPRAQGGKMRVLLNARISVYIDKAHAIAHNKVIIIDQKHVITGSYNFSHAAEKRNAENIVIIDGAELAQKYLLNFDTHLQHSRKVH